MTTQTPPVFDDFPTSFKGPVHRLGDEGYTPARSVWNMQRSEEMPKFIAQATDADDIVTAVTYAVAQDIPIAVRSGGHGICGSAMPHDAFVIDTSSMKAISVDAETGVTRLEAGVLLGEMDAATQEHGYAVPAGTVSTTGVSGLTLGGGIGHLARRFGATVDNLLSVDVVTMDGRTLTASATEHPDLFWGMRGAGHNLAIATAFTFQAHKVGPQVMSGVMIYTPEGAEALFDGVDAVLSRTTRELSVALVAMPAPPIPGLPEPVIGTPIVMNVVVYTGPLDRYDAAIEDVRELAEPVADLVGPISWLEANSIVDPFEPPGRRYYSGGAWLPRLSAEVARTALERVAAAPDEPGEADGCMIAFPALGGALQHDADEDSTAFSRRDAAWYQEAIGMWSPEKSDADYIDWVEGTVAAFQPYAARNGYVNLSADRGPQWLRDVYGSPEKWQRLVDLKRTWDPDNRLSYNKNIQRASLAGADA